MNIFYLADMALLLLFNTQWITVIVFTGGYPSPHHLKRLYISQVQARDLYRIRPLLDLNTSVLLANALASSRLDYCNSLFLSLTDFELRRLQLVQDSLCRVVTRSSKFSHITPQLKKLHWLPVRYRVQFTIGLITYKILTQGQPVYLRGLIHPYTSFRNTSGSSFSNSSSFKPPLIPYKILTQGQPVYLRGLIHPYTSFRNTSGSSFPNSSSFKPPLLIVQFTNQLNTFLILSVTMPLPSGTLSLSM